MKIEIENLTHIYKENVEQMIFNEISGTINKGDSLGIVGPSGMGKTTLLNIISGVLIPSMGGVFYDDIDITKQNDEFKSKFRREKMGFVFQDRYLLKQLNVKQNIQLPLQMVNVSKKEQEVIVDKLLNETSMVKHKNSAIQHLSGGQQQRIAIAVAIANSPSFVFADEPTGNLDFENSNMVIDLLLDTCKKRSATLIVATHDTNIMQKLDYLWEIKEKKIIKSKSFEL